MDKNIPWELIFLKLEFQISDKENRELSLWLSEQKNLDIYNQIVELLNSVESSSANYNPDVKFCWEKLSSRLKLETQHPLTARKTSSKNKWFYVAASILLVVSFLTIRYVALPSFNSTEKGLQTYSVLRGKSKIILVDGTEVWLHDNTSISYSSVFSDKRLISLSGEAYFNVAKDPERPFIVQTGDLLITVYGTQFNVKSSNISNQTSISLVEGLVSLKIENKEECFISPGQIAVFDNMNKTLLIDGGDVQFEKSWTNDQIVFEKNDLGHICKYLSKWYAVDIELDPDLRDKYYYTFTLRGETLEEIMRLISRLHPINYHFNNLDTLVITKKTK